MSDQAMKRVTAFRAQCFVGATLLWSIVWLVLCLAPGAIDVSNHHLSHSALSFSLIASGIAMQTWLWPSCRLMLAGVLLTWVMPALVVLGSARCLGTAVDVSHSKEWFWWEVVPMHMPALAVSLAWGALLVAIFRQFLPLRRTSERCTLCGYSLRGLPQPRCPACGTFNSLTPYNRG